MSYAQLQMEGETARLTERPWNLVRRTLGGREARRTKLRRLGEAVAGYGSKRRVQPRLERLRALGYIEKLPTRLQRMTGAVDMMRFWIIPCASDYYTDKGIRFSFHTLLRFLDDPASVIDPTGLNSSAETVIGHLMQVVHANPVYDLQLLEAIDGGLEQLEQECKAMLDGTHPRAESLLGTVEDPEYHARLLDYVQAYRRGEHRTLVRDNVRRSPHFAALERTFGALPDAMRYFATLPRTRVGAAAHLLLDREPPVAHAQPPH